MNENENMKTMTSTQFQRLRSAVADGWQSAKANLVPGLVIVALAAMMVASYYLFPAVSASLEGLVQIRQQLGIWFAMAASAIGAGIIPGLYLLLSGRARKSSRAGFDLLFTCLIWAATALAIDRFYVFQAGLWGSAVTIQIILGKMLLDQFVFTPLVGVQIPAIGFRFRDLNYDPGALWQELRRDWVIGVSVPLLVACWLTWIPGTLVIYALPLALQIPMMVLFQCFFALEVAYASSKM
jgi:hypothetical protein